MVLWVQRPRFAVSSLRARTASAVRSGTSRTGVQGQIPRRKSSSHLYRLPIPARLVWSRSASAMAVSGCFAIRRTASAGFQSGPSRSGPR
ncbi:MAG: hypothetical protein AUI10_10600 [Actinobacteria bacterium 13_2_20CM_2_72_6]|nr:MAG: hypothetical protein AUI10_10600 [Actinobacteria bacterium 13_2_20CM_2_72_6]